MNVTSRVFLPMALTIILTASGMGQTSSPSGAGAMPDVVAPAPQSDDEPYSLRRGDNENAGFLAFTKEVPIEDSGKFAFMLEGGGGVRIFTSERRAVTLGLRLHHISNGDRSGSNRGLNQFVFYAGFSVFK